MSKLIIIRGNSGSGKTTIAKHLQRKFGRNTMLISQDTVRREMLLVKDRINNESIPLLIELLKYGKINSEIVILEGILDSEKYMELFITAINEYKSNIHAYYYDLSFEETLLRHKTKNIFDFGEKEMRQWWKEKDYINIINETTLYKDLEIDHVVDMIFNKINNTNNS